MVKTWDTVATTRSRPSCSAGGGGTRRTAGRRRRRRPSEPRTSRAGGGGDGERGAGGEAVGAEPEGVCGNCFRTRSNLGRMKNDVGRMIRRNARNPRIKIEDEY